MKLKEMFSVLIASFLFIGGLSFIVKLLRFELGTIGYILALLILSFFILIIYKFVEKKSWKDYGIKKVRLQDIKYSFFFLFILFPIAFLGRIFDPGFDIWYAKQSGLLTFYGLLFSFLIMPLYVIKEEIFERSLIQSKLSQNYGSLIALFLVSLNFALMHFYLTKEMNHIITTVISVFFGSMALVLIYEITKNVFASLLTHLLYNILVVFQIYLHAKNYLIYESIFWIIFGLLFLLTFKKSWSEVKVVIKSKRVSLSFVDWIFFIVFASLPLVLYFLR